MTSKPALLWCDIETPNLRPSAPILEVGLRTADADLGTLAEASWVMPYTVGQVDHLHDLADPVVQEMHGASGLWGECATDLSWSECRERRAAIAAEIIQWIRTNAPGRLPLAGSSVRVDRAWLTRLAPELDADELIHYRIVDVSSVRILAQLWRPELQGAEPKAQKLHRVMPDLDDSIELLRHYRTHVFGGAS